ncbi:hypothetical protein P3H15_51200 [Rhodococcus sp. T2V]|uniref:hypothetical protein n=1 Tax=Rhodococcus sp. T2V TaxID=3034164 RepID=UPI0023E2E55B|nr:hypothetical protein [Rhodococcus sp. T2V]MDF3313288.1 hypothetical protein [Rhodococcus sp. T2V]
MAAYIRKVRTASGATAVQIAAKDGGRHKILEHLGSAHTDSELAALLQTAREKLHDGQQELDLDLDLGGGGERGSVIVSKRSRWLIDAISAAWHRLGFDVIDDEAFFQLVVGRLVEPTSMSDTSRVVGEIGMTPVHRNTYANTLKRCATRDYRDRFAKRCFEYAAETGCLSLVLYDVTTLYFEAEKEDELRKVGYSNYAEVWVMSMGWSRRWSSCRSRVSARVVPRGINRVVWLILIVARGNR